MAGKKEKDVVAAAARVFLRYGYKRVTMADLAEAARLSRPALYLVFSSKEAIFTAVMAQAFTAMLAEIREGLGRLSTAEEKLTFATKVWCVRPFETILASPDAKDLLQSSYEFATAVTTKAASDFVALVAEILDPLVQRQKRVNLSSVQIAQLLASALLGFKESARNVAQLRELIAGLIGVILASLQAPHVIEERRKKRATKSRSLD